ncbi:MAG: hypothetical protein JWM78_3660 [Verrucomicrobiaceae bacterium]|nr:hypothetical protein [Verrucomicrobiaceae bacterium]
MSKNKKAETAGLHWWVVSLSEDVSADKPLGVICDGRDYVLFRDAGGAVRALLDQCAHRRAPLSLGRITAQGWIECPYHGWRYSGESGSCVNIPNLSAEEKVPGYGVDAFAVEERDGFIQLGTEGLHSDRTQLADFSLAQKSAQWHASHLIAYPHDALVDLLLDAPGAVLQIPGATILNNHRYGEPIVSPTTIEVTHAVAWTPRGKMPKQAQADFPLALRLMVEKAGHSARVELSDDTGAVLIAVAIGLSPVKRNLTAALWRATGEPYRERILELGVRAHLDALEIKHAYVYPSLLRRDSAAEQLIAIA